LEILARLHKAVYWRRSELQPYIWILHHINASAHDVLAVQEFLAKKSMLTFNLPPQSPDLALCDFWIFPKLKTALISHRFLDVSDIQGHATTILKSIPEEEFHKSSEQWKHRLTKCIVVQGDYFKVERNH
jgi:hypothetical protein